MNHERTVLVDMDGTIADFDGTLVADLRAEHPEIEIPERKSFYFEHDFPEQHHDVIKGIISRPGFFLRHGIIEGAIDGWAGLIEAGYQPRICTAPLRKNRFSIPDKINWLEEHLVPVFGTRVIDTAIIDKHKFRHPALALIDDRDDIEDVRKASWEHIVFDQPYNHECKAQYRMLGWHDRGVFVALGSIANRAA